MKENAKEVILGLVIIVSIVLAAIYVGFQAGVKTEAVRHEVAH